jgi:integrase
MKLTSKTVGRIELPRDKSDLIVFDADLAGFGIRLRRSGDGKVRRSYVVQYRRTGGTRRALLGSAEVLTAELARAAAKEILAKVALGEDPQADKAARRAKDAHSLRSVIDEYLAAKESRVRPRTFQEARRYLQGPHFKPLHAMPLDRITRRDVATRLVAITRESGPITAARARATLSAMFVWTMGQGLAEGNPVIGTTRPDQPQSRERVLDDRELAAILRACKDDDHGRIVRLLALTGCRRQEVGGMAWSELDLERGAWTIPAARTKNARAHELPLPPLALSIIESVPRMVSREQLFGVRGSGFTRWSASKRELDERAGVAEWHLHDLRRTTATRMADLKVQPHIIEAVLNHHSGHRAGVAGIYNRSVYTNEVRAALALWADHVWSIIDGGERKIVPMPRRVP